MVIPTGRADLEPLALDFARPTRDGGHCADSRLAMFPFEVADVVCRAVQTVETGTDEDERIGPYGFCRSGDLAVLYHQID